MKYRSFSAVIILIAVITLFSTAAIAVAQSFVPEHEELISSENVLSVSMDDANRNDAVQPTETQPTETQPGETQTDSVSPSEAPDSSNEIMPSTAEHIEGVGGIDLAKVSDKPEKVVMHHES